MADEQVGEQERPEVADVGRSVDRRAARVDPDPVVVQRHERARLAGQRVVQLEAHRPAATEAITSAEMLRPAPSGAVEVAARRLDVDRRRLESEQGRDRVAHRIEIRPETRPAGDDRQVDARRIPAGSPETGKDLLDEPPARDALGGPGVGREEPAEVAQSGGTEQGVGQGVQDDVAVGVTGQPRRAGDLDPAESRVAAPVRTGGCRARSRCASRTVRSGRPPTLPRSAGSVTLRLPGSPGTTWTSMLQASRRAASSVKVCGPVGREAPVRLAQEVAPDALWRLRGAQVAPVDRGSHQVAVERA